MRGMPRSALHNKEAAVTKRQLKPVLDGDWWLIGPSPDLKGVLPGAERWKGQYNEHNAPVDHHIVQDIHGVWHLWGCVRSTATGRIFYHWKSDDILRSPWECTGEIIRIRSEYGESYGSSPGEGSSERPDEECIQSPYFVKVDGTYYMFYGGGSALPTAAEAKEVGVAPGKGAAGAQMCLMSSKDGVTWTRHRNADGNSRLFIGPGPTRDPCLIEIDGVWHLYYAGSHPGEIDRPVFWLRTSGDLLNWSAPEIVHEDLSYGAGRWDTECPFVVFRDGYYYLFRTEDYYKSLTHVFRSEDPTDFGIGDASSKYVGVFPVAAPELYTIDGHEYVSSNHNPPLGTQMCRMKWVDDG